MALRPRPETHCCCGARGKVAVKWNDDRQRLIWLARIDAEAELLISTTNNQMPAMLIDVFGDLRSETWDVNGRRDAKACRSRREEDDGGEHLWLPEDGRLIGRKPRFDRERSAPNARQGARVLFPRPLRRRRPLEQWCCSLLDRQDCDAGTPTRTPIDRDPSDSHARLMTANWRLMASLVPARCVTRKGCPPSPPTDSRVSARWGVAHRASRDAVSASHQMRICGV
jgi:hypothetical protein